MSDQDTLKKETRTPSAFKPTVKDKEFKVLIWGAPGSGKTPFGLSSPKPLVADFEKSTYPYIGKFDFYLARIDKTMKQDNKDSTKQRKNNTPYNLIINLIEELNYGIYGNEVETLVIDPINDLLDNLESGLVDKYEKDLLANSKKKSISDLNQLEKTKWYAYRRTHTRNILDKIINLPVNIVWVAREKNIWDTQNGKMQPVGKTYEGLDIIESLVDVVINSRKDEESHIVTKSRGIKKLPDDYYLKTWDDLVGIYEEADKKEKSKTKTAEKAK